MKIYCFTPVFARCLFMPYSNLERNDNNWNPVSFLFFVHSKFVSLTNTQCPSIKKIHAYDLDFI